MSLYLNIALSLQGSEILNGFPEQKNFSKHPLDILEKFDDCNRIRDRCRRTRKNKAG